MTSPRRKRIKWEKWCKKHPDKYKYWYMQEGQRLADWIFKDGHIFPDKIWSEQIPVTELMTFESDND